MTMAVSYTHLDVYKRQAAADNLRLIYMEELLPVGKQTFHIGRSDGDLKHEVYIKLVLNGGKFFDCGYFIHSL